MCISLTPLVFAALLQQGIVYNVSSPEIFRGLPAIQNYRSNDYLAGPNNHAIAQDDRGLLYFANDEGVLVFDGERWQLIRTPGNATVRALYYTNGTVYFGSQDDLGYLAPDSGGQLQFVSMKQHVPEAHRDFKGIWEIVAIEDTVFFRSYYAVFRWSNGEMTVWKPETLFHNAYVAGGSFYVREHNVGLKRLEGDSLISLPGGEKLANETFAGLWSTENGRLVGITRFHGIWQYDGVAFRDISTPADSFLYNSLVFHAIRLPGGQTALATHRQGLALLDSTGNLLQVVGRAAGLRSNTMNFVHADRQGGLWLALNNGLARVETPSPFSYFGEATGLEESINDLRRHQGRLYAATTLGVFMLDPEAKPFSRFEKVAGIEHTAWCFLYLPGRLLAGTHRGVYVINAGQVVTQISGVPGATRLQAWSKDDGRILVGHYRGLGMLELRPGGEHRFRQIRGVSGYVLEIAEDEEGALWAGTRDGLFSVSIDDTNLTSPEAPIPATVVRYGQPEGLPDGPVRPFQLGNFLRFATTAGIYRFDPDSLRFLRDASLMPHPVDSLTAILRLQEDTQGNVWLFGKKGTQFLRGCLAPQSNRHYRWDERLSNRLADLGEPYAIYPDAGSVIWFGGAEGLLRYAATVPKSMAKSFSAMIRSVRAMTTDSLFYGGTPTKHSAGIEIPYALHSLRFEYAVPAYDQPDKNEFQVFLEGFDPGWSRWSGESSKDYTGLGPGRYTFHVRARDVYGQVSDEDVFTFRIRPPWFLSWWAYLFYAGVAVAFISLIIKARVQHLQKKTRNLEALVAERTATVKEQAEKLQEMDRVKSRFFANISHEFRTPLTLILGPLEERLEKAVSKRDKEEFGMMHRNAQRVLRLINQLLDLSRLEAGRLTLRAGRGDFINCLRGIVMSFASLAQQRGIDLQFEPPAESPNALANFYFDREKLEQVFFNLLANAFKFTPDGGSVMVDCRLRNADLSGEPATGNHPAIQNQPSQIVEIRIRDTGIGIPGDRLPNIFDRFYQVEDGEGRTKEGTGIGLALAKELVELHHGSIEVNSEAGVGTEFIVRLPLGRKHLAEEEIVDAAEAYDEAFSETQPEDIPSAEPSEGSKASESRSRDETVVLIVDDHPDVRSYIRSHLPARYQIVEADNGRSGLEMALDKIPDLVISDVMMPQMDGFELCAALKTDQRTSHIPVILLTARAGEEDKLSGLETGADDYLTKPFSYRELQARAHNLIQQRCKLRERFVREGMLRPREVAVTSVDEVFLQRVMDTLEEHMTDEGFGVEQLSRQVNMGVRQLHRKVRALTARSPVEFIRLVRLQRAKRLLEQNAGTVSEIAYQVGFSNLSYFSKVFREEFGKLPSDFVNRK